MLSRSITMMKFILSVTLSLSTSSRQALSKCVAEVQKFNKEEVATKQVLVQNRLSSTFQDKADTKKDYSANFASLFCTVFASVPLGFKAITFL